MNKEILIHTGTCDFKVFLQNGFYQNHVPTSYIHRHNYSEIHTVNGDAVFTVGDKSVPLRAGEVLAIPKRMLHKCDMISTNAEHAAFQTTLDIPAESIQNFSKETVDEFISEIKKCEENGIYNAISAYITLLTSPFISNVTLSADNITDYGFLINEFFSHNYNNEVSLTDLAEVLHVSTRHAERLVKEYTGNSFGKELTKARMEMADYLIKTTNLPLSEIAQKVGYRSYAGFYKAMKNAK